MTGGDRSTWQSGGSKLHIRLGQGNCENTRETISTRTNNEMRRKCRKLTVPK
jgi:hypothetical protein